MIVAGQRVESLNCGWVVALEDAPVARGGYVRAKFEGTGCEKPVMTTAFITGNLRDTNHALNVGDILRSTADGNFEILKIENASNVVARFFNTGNIVKCLQKNAVICGYVKDQVLKEDKQYEVYMAQETRERSRYGAEEAKRLQAEQRAAWKLCVAAKKVIKTQKVKDYWDNKVARDIELRENAIKALDVCEVDKGENQNDINIDFKDRDGKWVLNFGWQDKFYHTRLGRYYNNMSQRVGKNGYADVTASEDFADAQKFCDWAVQQPGWGMGYCLEKDLLGGKSRHYSAENCCFVPHIVNTSIVFKEGKTVVVNKPDGWHVKFMKNYLNIFLGAYPCHGSALSAYHKYRENYVKNLAEIYKNKISERAYEALLCWKAC